MFGDRALPLTVPGNWLRRAPDGTTITELLAPEPDPVRAKPQRPLLPTGWPLIALYLGFPLWWVLGLAQFMLPVTAGFMAVQLLRRRPVILPRGFAIWGLFMLCVLAGVFFLGVEAPGAIQDDGGFGRYLTFGYRALLYLSATVGLLYIGNADRDALPTRTVVRLLGFMFVVTTIGGLAGALLPPMEFRAALEYVLPGGLSHNSFIQALVHPRTAAVQSVLGYAESRPVAPFFYANDWGANYSFFLPFFLLAWFGRDAGWRRYVGPFILLASFVPVIYSLNRGLWSALAVGLAFVVIRLLIGGQAWAAYTLVTGLLVGAVVLFLTPMIAIIQERLAHPHSNDRREQLFTLTFSAVWRGSPFLGFGTTRNVQGSFASIAGGDTAACGGCGVPPLGTQGALTSVIFFQGILGLILFLLFFALWVARHLRDTSPLTLAAISVIVIAAVEMFVYDFIGFPLFIAMVSIGLVWRERRTKELQE
jgi:hypothetical protein